MQKIFTEPEVYEAAMICIYLVFARPYTGLHCETADTGLVYRAVYPALCPSFCWYLLRLTTDEWPG